MGVAIEEVDIVTVAGGGKVTAPDDEAIGATGKDDGVGEDAFGPGIAEGEVEAVTHLVERSCFGAGEFPVGRLFGGIYFCVMETLAEFPESVGWRVQEFSVVEATIAIGAWITGDEGPAFTIQVICGGGPAVVFPRLVKVEGTELLEI